MDRKKVLLRWAPKAMAAVFLVLFLGAIVYFLKDIIFGDKSHKKQVIHEIALMKPPPPPRPEEKPPEPEVKKEEVKVPEPETPLPPDQPDNARQDDTPPANDLGLDADGQAGSDGFGLAANKGGRGIIAGGGGQGGDRNRYAWYGNLLERDIQNVLSKDKDLTNENYKVIVKLWLNNDGTVDRVDLANSSGDVERDKLIRLALGKMKSVKEPPPEGMPQPVKLRITSL